MITVTFHREFTVEDISGNFIIHVKENIYVYLRFYRWQLDTFLQLPWLLISFHSWSNLKEMSKSFMIILWDIRT